MDSQSKPKPRLARSVLPYREVSFTVPEWLEIGQSFFLPCLKAEELGSKVQRHYAGTTMRMVWEERIEADYLGIRVWRVL